MTLKNILNDNNKTSDEKLCAVGAVRDCLDFKSLTEKEAVCIINDLIEQVVKQPDNNIKEAIFDAMLEGYCSYNIEKKISLKPIVEDIQRFDVQCLSYILTLLGWSGKEEYRGLITSFADNPILEEDVEEALSELNHRVKNV